MDPNNILPKTGKIIYTGSANGEAYSRAGAI
jgi:hypothetical protein